MDLNVHDLSQTGRNCFLSLTTPRPLVRLSDYANGLINERPLQVTTIKSALKLRFTSRHIHVLIFRAAWPCFPLFLNRE